MNYLSLLQNNLFLAPLLYTIQLQQEVFIISQYLYKRHNLCHNNKTPCGVLAIAIGYFKAVWTKLQLQITITIITYSIVISAPQLHFTNYSNWTDSY